MSKQLKSVFEFERNKIYQSTSSRLYKNYIFKMLNNFLYTSNNKGRQWYEVKDSFNVIAQLQFKEYTIPTEVPNLTDDEKAVLRLVSENYAWIGRDTYKNSLFLYSHEPCCGDNMIINGIGDIHSLKPFVNSFDSIKPMTYYKIEDLLREGE
jgi:hypothetical protein